MIDFDTDDRGAVTAETSSWLREYVGVPQSAL